MQICACPRSAALTTIPNVTCLENWGQTQKIAVQRLATAAGALNGFTDTNDIKLKASWTALLAAAADTKIVVPPYIQAPVAEAGAPRTFGGGNETLNGIEVIIGRDATPFTGVFRQIPQSVIATIKLLQCEQIGVFMFNENGQIMAIQAGTTEDPIYRPIPIMSFFVGDKTLGGFEGPDGNNVQWSFYPNWSDNIVILNPTDFNPLTDLVPAA